MNYTWAVKEWPEPGDFYIFTIVTSVTGERIVVLCNRKDVTIYCPQSDAIHNTGVHNTISIFLNNMKDQIFVIFIRKKENKVFMIIFYLSKQ